MPKLDRQKTIKKIELLREQKNRIKYNALKYYQPYPKQLEFHETEGVPEVTDRMLGAGTQCGKTYAGSMEMAYHLTGLYPEWWKGEVFKKPVIAWVCGVNGKALRDSLQLLMLGDTTDESDIGSRAIPKDCIIEMKSARGVADLIDTVSVKHVSGGTSKMTFKTYTEGRLPFQSATIDIIWFDEEPPEEIYSEGKARTNNGQNGQCVYVTFTPLKGMTTVAYGFYKNPSIFKRLTIMTIHDVGHYTPAQRAGIIAGYPSHEREAREMGTPTVGEGRVFLTDEKDLHFNNETFPRWFPKLVGMDFGYGQSDEAHPSALAHIAWDRDRDIVYIQDAYYVKKPTPIKVAGTMRSRCQDIDWIPVAWPHDAMKSSGGNEKGTVADLHKNQGMQMLQSHATFEDGGNSVEAGIMIMDERMDTGGLKVASHLSEWFDEYRMYHREKGQIVKLRDDLMSATRYAIMSLRYAETEPVQNEYDDYDSFENSNPGGY